ncbi:MAG TPA: T9SS type A sorting domain-containing protein [Saprospiraceae bacterium]|nr:T9SS type A sorting domain-containing protein [Saprospiraceae bacterium]
MFRLSILIYFIIFGLTILNAQPINNYKYDFNWISGIDTFGNSTANPNKINNCLHFNFNGDTLKIKMEVGFAHFSYTCASISNKEGDLQFFTNGCNIYNREYNIMDNGDVLNNPFILYNECNGDYYTGYNAPQGAIILPRFGSDSLYDLISIERKQQPNFDIIMQYLHYSVIDMSFNNGLGKVIEKNSEILNDSLGGILTAVRHSDNKSWWLISKKFNSSVYLFFLFDSTGYVGMHKQNIGIFDKGNDASGNGTAFSPDGKKYAHYEPRQGLFLYDFDRENGGLSNFKFINVVGQMMDTLQDGFISFSPNSQFIYISEGANLWQVDTEIDSLKYGLELIAQTDFVNNPNSSFFTTFGLPTLGPDCRIYIGMYGAQPWFTVINNPDEKGKACNVVSAKTELPMWQWPAFPNMINYRLGTGQPTCDSNKIVLTADNFIIMPVNGPLQVYPNPGIDYCRVTGFGSEGGKLQIVNNQGEILQTIKVNRDVTQMILNTSELQRGFYFIRYINKNQVTRVCKWVKI